MALSIIGALASVASSIAVNLVTDKTWLASASSLIAWMTLGVFFVVTLTVSILTARTERTSLAASPAVQAAIELLEKSLELTSYPHETRATTLLPKGSERFVDRRQELNEINTVLHNRAKHRRGSLITLYGMPGAGKTSLAIEAAGSKDSDTSLFLDMSTPAFADDPFSSLGTLIRQLSPDCRNLPLTLADRRALWAHVTSNRSLVVVYDGASNEKAIRQILPTNSRNVAIVTSRRPILVDIATCAMRLHTLPRREGKRLVLGVSRRPELDLEADLDEVCRLCGDLPLALTIAGGLLRKRPDWSFEYLAQRLRRESDRLDVLKLGNLEVRSSLSVSYSTLTPDEQELLKAISSLSVPYVSIEMCAAVLDVDECKVGQLIDGLVDAQLLEVQDDAFGLHDLVRAYGAEQAARREGFAKQARIRSVKYGAALVADRATHLEGPRPHAADAPTMTRPISVVQLMDELDPEVWAVALQQANKFIKSIDWFRKHTDLAITLTRDAFDLGLAEELLSLSGSLYKILATTGRLSDLVEVGRLAHQSALLGSPSDRITADLIYGYALRASGRPIEAIEVLSKTITLAEATGCWVDAGRASRIIGGAYREIGRLDAAATSLQHAIDLLMPLNELVEVASTHSEIGLMLKDGGNLVGAIDELSRSVHALGMAVQTDRAFPPPLAWSLEELASAYKRSGNTAAALAGHLRSLELFTALGDPQGQAYALRNLGDLAAGLQLWHWAEALFGRAREMQDRCGDFGGYSQAAISLALASGRRGRLVHAVVAASGATRGVGIVRTARFGVSRIVLWSRLARAMREKSLGDDNGSGDAARPF